MAATDPVIAQVRVLTSRREDLMDLQTARHTSIAITADTYTEVFAEVDHAAADSAASVVPLRRRRRRAAV